LKNYIQQGIIFETIFLKSKFGLYRPSRRVDLCKTLGGVQATAQPDFV